MRTHRHCRRDWFVFSLFVFFCSTLLAESQPWKNAHLLDPQTQSQLKGYDDFFESLFQYPEFYRTAQEKEKKQLIAGWIKELQGGDCEKAMEAAAYLSMVKSEAGLRVLQKTAAEGRCGNRMRWICTRSLGQIPDKSSVPILIELLDYSNRNVQVYARVSLAEITGVYFGDDKEKWTARQKEPSAVSCDPNQCTFPAEHPLAGRFTVSDETLRFTLRDVHGRIVDSDDYLGFSVLYIIGACWCGGCQQDMEPFREFTEKYAGRGLQAVRIIAWDNELAALDFAKHYRLSCVHLLDSNREIERQLNNRSWTFLVLADPDGKVVYRVNGPKEEDYRKIQNLLAGMLPNPPKTTPLLRDGIRYMPATLERSGETDKSRLCERFSSAACGPDGQVYIMYTTNINGNLDVKIRICEKNKWTEDLYVVPSLADEYDGHVIVDRQGTVWTAWTGNTQGNKFNVYITSFDRDMGKVRMPFQLTDSEDDAMGPRMAIDRQGDLWVTYYKWHKHKGRSRDKEVYVRRLKRGEWSDEIQVSPTDVPWYEDHTEPAITAYRDGVLVGWNWDFHSPIRGYSSVAGSPTIFIRAINSEMKMGKVSSVSARNVDMTPALIAAGDQIFAAWDSAQSSWNKRLCIAVPFAGVDNLIERIQPFEEVRNVCTPSYALSPNGTVTLLWSETRDNHSWVLKRMDYDPIQKQWSGQEVIERKGNPRFACGAYDSNGKLWAAYSIETEKGREIAVKEF